MTKRCHFARLMTVFRKLTFKMIMTPNLKVSKKKMSSYRES